MNLTEDELLDLYSEKLVAHLLTVSPDAIDDLIEVATCNNFLRLTHRLFSALDEDSILSLNRKHDNYIEKTGLDFVMRALSRRDFGPAEKIFLDEQLPKFSKVNFDRRAVMVAVNRSTLKSRHEIATYAQVSAIANGCSLQIIDYLMRDGCNFMLLGGTASAKDRTPLYANVLGSAIIAGNVPAFKKYLDLCSKDPAIDITSLPIVEINGGEAIKTKSIDAVIASFCPVAVFDDMIKALQIIKPITTSDCDDMLFAHLLSGPVLSGNAHNWNDQVIETVLLYRKQEDPFPNDLLQRAIINACNPILDEAARTHQVSPKKFRDAGNNSVDVVACLIHCGADFGRISSSLEALKGMGYDFHQKCSDDMSPLMKAAEADRLDILAKLLELGVDPYAKTSRGWTARSYLKSPQQKTQYDVLIAALKAKQKISAVINAARGHSHP